MSSLLDFLSRGLVNASWPWIAGYLLLVTQLTILTVTLYLHRSQAHRGVEFHPVLNHFFRFWGWLTTGMVTREWVAVHRKHHAKVETAEDPHSPQVYGIGRVFWDGVTLYRQASAVPDDLERYGRGAPEDWIERHLYTAHSTWGPTLMLLVDLALFGVLGAAVWAIQMMWIPVWGAGFINGVGHWWGYRNFETPDTAANIVPLGCWVGGEELHNNHHAYPSSARFSQRRWEFDLGWGVICVLRAMGLARVLRVAPPLSRRGRVRQPDMDTLLGVRTHRYYAMRDFYRHVILPTLREEAARLGPSRLSIPQRMRNALANGGRWLDSEGRGRLHLLTARLPRLATVCEFRGRLTELLDSRCAASALHGLERWIAEAEQSGIDALKAFALRLKGYSARR